MNLASAQKAILQAQNKAQELGINVDIAIVDLGAHLLAFARMDGAWVGSIDIAIKKARTSALFCKNTQDFSPLVQPGMPLYNIEHSNGGMITFPGGVVIRDQQGQPMAAIGISGSTIENDHAVALAGAENI